MTNIVLIGFMGTGKSAVGHALATRLHARFLDTDTEIERETGQRVAQIFSTHGEEHFRHLENKLLHRLAHEPGPMVLATGGGTPLRAENAALLKKIGPLVWLTAPTQTILGRVRRNLAQRPLLAGYPEDPVKRVQQMLADRNPCYAALAAYEFDTSNFENPEEVASCILTMLGKAD